MEVSKARIMRRCAPGQFRKPRENARNVFLYKIFKDRCSMEYGATPHPVRKAKSPSGWSYHSVKYKPKKNLHKHSHIVSVEEGESDFFEDALDEFFLPVNDYFPEPVKVSTDSLRIKLEHNDGLTAEVYDPINGPKWLRFTKDELSNNCLEFVFEPNPELEPKLTVLLGNVPIYAVNKTKGYGDCDLRCTKTDVGVQTSYTLLDIDPLESDICTSHQNVNSVMIETTGKQISLDELPYDKEVSSYTIKGLTFDYNSVENTFNNLSPPSLKIAGLVEPSENTTVSDCFTQNSHPNLLANKLRDKSFANLVNRTCENYCSPHTTSLVSSIPSDDVSFQCKPCIPSRKFSMKSAFRPSVDTLNTVMNETLTTLNEKENEVTQNGDTLNTSSTLYINNDNLSHLTDASKNYLNEILQKAMQRMNFTEEEELNRISENTALCFIENSETSTSCEDVNSDHIVLQSSPAMVDLTKFSEETGATIVTNKSESEDESVHLSFEKPEINLEINDVEQLTDVPKKISGGGRTPDESLDNLPDSSKSSLESYRGEKNQGSAPEESYIEGSKSNCINEIVSETSLKLNVENETKQVSVADVQREKSNIVTKQSSEVLNPTFEPSVEENVFDIEESRNKRDSVQKFIENVETDTNCGTACPSNSTTSLEQVIDGEETQNSKSNSSLKESLHSPSKQSQSSDESNYRDTKKILNVIMDDEPPEAAQLAPIAQCHFAEEVDVERTKNGLRLPTPVDSVEFLRERSESKILETDKHFSFLNKRPSKAKGSGSASDVLQSEAVNSQVEKTRPQTTVSTRTPDRPMTSVSQALKGVETALKPLQDQLKEIRTKMASLNHHFYNQYAEEKLKGPNSEKNGFLSVGKETEVLPMKYYVDRNRSKVNGMKINSKDVRNEKEAEKKAHTISRAARYEAISIWSEPEDIIGDSPLPSVNLSFLGAKKTV